MSNLNYCYNKGCGKQFGDVENGPEACVYHSGNPFFHDAYKGWSCCNKKCTDFTEFLNIKGCTKGWHNPQKPEIEVKSKTNDNAEKEIRKIDPPKPKGIIIRPDENLPMVYLKVNVSKSLEEILLKKKSLNSLSEESSKFIKLICKHNGCQQDYDNGSEICDYHTGMPVFHEGYKYWSCCKKKTSDFGTFLQQKGCISGKHEWIPKEEHIANQNQCRYDWHQTGPYVFISIYLKTCDPNLSRIEANAVHIKIFLKSEQGTFNLDMILQEVVNLQESEVYFMPSKVEIKLRKVEPISWKQLGKQIND